ncbi:MAG: hypothetical protein M3Z25_06265 [Actinomycetota bacterium]|nr:hypothetical protein [Actinomycetota bacterium]
MGNTDQPTAVVTAASMSAPTSAPWYTQFFTELPNEFWRRVTSPAATEAEVTSSNSTSPWRPLPARRTGAPPV